MGSSVTTSDEAGDDVLLDGVASETCAGVGSRAGDDVMFSALALASSTEK